MDLKEIATSFREGDIGKLVDLFLELDQPQPGLLEMLRAVVKDADTPDEVRPIAKIVYIMYTALGQPFLRWWRNHTMDEIFAKDALVIPHFLRGNVPLGSYRSTSKPNTMVLELQLADDEGNWIAILLCPKIHLPKLLQETHLEFPETPQYEEDLRLPGEVLIDDIGGVTSYYRGREQHSLHWARRGIIAGVRPRDEAR